MLSVRSLLVYWPGLSADVRDAIRDVDPADPSALAHLADLLVEGMGLDLEDSCELVGINESTYTTAHAPWRQHPRIATRSSIATRRLDQ